MGFYLQSSQRISWHDASRPHQRVDAECDMGNVIKIRYLHTYVDNVYIYPNET